MTEYRIAASRARRLLARSAAGSFCDRLARSLHDRLCHPASTRARRRLAAAVVSGNPRALAAFCLMAVALVMSGCASPAAGPGGRVYAADVTGAAKVCEVPRISPIDGQTMDAQMKLGNDGGWCGITVWQTGYKAYDAGLLSSRPAHGNVMIHQVGNSTRIDYTPDRGFTGGDSFTVKLLPGNAVINIGVSVSAAGVAGKA